MTRIQNGNLYGSLKPSPGFLALRSLGGMALETGLYDGTSCVVSVVIPAYNGEKYIRRCLGSLCEQNLDGLEIVVVDDGSTDNTAEVAESLLSTSGRPYRVVSQANKGVSAARNRGLEIARGQYIMFLDCDDYIDSNCLVNLLRLAKSEDSDVVFCGYDYVSEEGEVLVSYDSRHRYLECPTLGPEVLISVFLENVSVWTGSTMYRKELLDRYNLRYTVDRTIAEDLEFEFKALFHAKLVSSVNESLSFYVQRPTSLTSTVGLLKRFQGMDALFDVRRYFAEWVSGDSSLKLSLELGGGNEDPASEVLLQREALKYLETYMIPVSLAGVFGSVSKDGYPRDKLRDMLRTRSDFATALCNFSPVPHANKASRRALQVRLLQHTPSFYFAICRVVGLLR